MTHPEEGRTIWEMITQREKAVAKAQARPAETKPEFFNPLGLHLEDVALYTPGSERFRFQVTEIDVFDRGEAGKIVDYRLYQKPDGETPELDRYLQVFPGETQDGKPSADMLLLEWRFDAGYDQSVEDALERGEFPIQGDEYQGFVRNQNRAVPFEANVTEIKIGGAPTTRRIKYWDFVRIKDGVTQDVFFIEYDLDTRRFDAYIATMVAGGAFRFLKKK